jgi:hypothetical protein
MFLLDAGGTVIDFGSIAFIHPPDGGDRSGHTPAPDGRIRALLGETLHKCLRRARPFTRVQPTSGDESVVTGRFFR